MANIHQKILAIQKVIDVEYDATLPENKGGKPYRSSEAIVTEVKKYLNEHGIITTIRDLKIERGGGIVGEGAGARYRPNVSLTGKVVFIDAEDGSEHYIEAAGEGSDVGGDSSIPKATTTLRRIAFEHQFHLSGSNIFDSQGIAANKDDLIEPSEKAPSAIDFKGRINSGIKSKKVTSDEVNSTGDNLAPGMSRAEWMKDPAILSQVVTALGL